MMEDYNRPLSPCMFVDATAAIGVAHTIGLVKDRHLETQSLWLQESVGDKRIGLSKVHGPVKLADLMTQHVDLATQIRLQPDERLGPLGQSGDGPRGMECRRASLLG